MPSHRQRLPGDVAAIFVHAGAGYHSVQNEKVHLQACADAAKAAISFLKSGGSAIDAVEVAIKVLEDKEITNAGYGSNLAMDGTVECDATIVDHFGRSGAVGAVGQVLNPIHLARLVLEHSTQPMSLRRVPPNLLVGQGATDFAYEMDMPIVPKDYLISIGAKERWVRWKRDLRRAQQQQQERRSEAGSRSDTRSDTVSSEEPEKPTFPRFPSYDSREKAGLRLESQSYSPQLVPTMISDAIGREDPTTQQLLANGMIDDIPTALPLVNGATTPYSSPLQRQLYTDSSASPRDWNSITPDNHGNDGQSSQSIGIPADFEEDETSIDMNASIAMSQKGRFRVSRFDRQPQQGRDVEEDYITDTVGAIAVDCFGHIAAGSSSGGIGMKHKGRTGPAALVGIGTSVVPIEPEDKLKTCVATITSGTGEHMATTLAAGTCAQRLYHNQKRGRDGKSLNADEETAIRSFVEKDFMNHPSVKNNHSAGAIGVLGVKKTTEGVWLHFAHNTDSFAIASMHTEEDDPRCVMSRSSGNNSITTGARSIKYRPQPQKRSASPRQSRAEEEGKTPKKQKKAKMGEQ